MDYWKECIAEAFADARVVASEAQIATVAEWVRGAHENYGMAHGHECISNPLVEENKKLSLALRIEKEKVICQACGGTGSITSSGPCHSATSPCWKCVGTGRHSR